MVLASTLMNDATSLFFPPFLSPAVVGGVCVCVLKVGSGEGGLSKTSAGDVTDAEWLDFM